MIIIIVGGIGSGKTLLAIRQMLHRRNPAFTNFATRGIPDVVRLEWKHLFIYGEKKSEVRINWDFWRKAQSKGFDLYFDEIHNLIPARRSMSNRNLAMNNFLSQIRKILGGTRKYNLYLITQRPNSIDTHFRWLAHEWWSVDKTTYNINVPCRVIEKGRLKRVYLPLTKFAKTAYGSQGRLEMGVGGVQFSPFIGNRYYRFYDTFSVVDDLGEDKYVA